MATEKTPAHKRIRRAETGRDDWKIKATERRVENEKLKKDLESKNATLSEMTNQILELKATLDTCSKQIREQDKLIDAFKKKPK